MGLFIHIDIVVLTAVTSEPNIYITELLHCRACLYFFH